MEDLMSRQNREAANRGISNQKVVVLGGSSGIGFAVAQMLVDQGASAVIASSSPNRVKEAVAMLDGKAEGYTLDLSNERDIQVFFQNIGNFDHLVFTAGDSLQLSELRTTDLGKARRAFELRYWAVLGAVKYASPFLRKDGSIVLTTGIAGERPRKGWALAASVCGAIVSLTRALAVELAPIRVNAVSPGVVRTNLWNTLHEQDRNSMYDSLGKSLLVGRVGEAYEIAQAYLFLMREGYSTGQTITVDGGGVLV
jgi:NAD(P)-dependent dehydrogenase (short-subunit alcohol dehydrogenase family)